MTPEERESLLEKRMRLIETLQAERDALTKERDEFKKTLAASEAEHKATVAQLTKDAAAQIAARDQAIDAQRQKHEGEVNAFIAGAQAVREAASQICDAFASHPDTKAKRVAQLQAQADAAAKALEAAKGA